MKVHIKKTYLKRNLRKHSPARFHARQPKGVGTDVFATVKLAPVLRKHKDLHKGIMKHEEHEIREWGKGRHDAHERARLKEPKATRKLASTKEFWQEIERRKRGK
jgi:hypothetical protein